MKSRTTIRILSSIVLIVGGLFMTGVIANFFRSAAADSSAYPNSTITPTKDLPSGLLANCDRAFDIRKRLPSGAKRDIFEAEYQACVNALSFYNATPRAIPIPPMRPIVPDDTSRRAAGLGTIIDTGISPLVGSSESPYIVINQWTYARPNEILTVYAGAKKIDDLQGGNTLQGMLFVTASTPEGESLPDVGGIYLTPSAQGPIRIVDAQGEQLTLAAPDGTGYFFNVSSRRFILPGPPSPVERLSGSGKIIETGATRLAIPKYAFENQWVETKGDSQVNVLAGADQTGSLQGIVMVVITGVNDPDKILEKNVYPAPLHYGSLRIVDASGEMLTLADKGGDMFVFDVSSLQYVSWPEVPPDVVVPQTPMPLAYP